jgi:DNA repair protein RadC
MSIHDGHRQRFKGEFLARPDSFPDHKVLEVLLFFANPRGDTNPVAHALMERFDSISGVLDATPEELQKVSGVGDHTVTLLKVTKELAGRYFSSRTSLGEIVQTSDDVEALLKDYFVGARSERVCLLCMDGKGKSLGVRVVGEGSVNSAEITSRAVVEAALSLNATQAILAHNHVSGIATPSDEDRVTTDWLNGVLASVGVRLRDHVIFADDEMVSMRDSKHPF